MTDQDIRFLRCSDTLTAEVGGEIVALNVDKGQCYGLNEIASRVWELIAEPASLGEICDTLMQEYEIDLPTCQAEVRSLLDDLVAEGLVRRVGA
jgi:hypothetical protein